MAFFAKNQSPAAADELQHVTEAMYEKNLELNERNKTLALLRKIDEIVLSSEKDTRKVAQQVVETIVTETDFKLVTIFLREGAHLKLFATSRQDAVTELETAVNALLLQEISVHKGEHPANVVTQNGEIKSYELHDFLKDHLAPEQSGQVGAFMELKTMFVCPLVVRARPLGVLLMGSPQTQNQISDYKQNLVNRLTGVVAIALDSSLLYRELQQANKHLKELDRAKDEFISMASHQLRTPLTTIKGYLSMMEEGDAGKINRGQRQFIDNALSGSTRMSKMIGELLNVSRMTTGKFKIEPAKVNLTRIVQDEINQLRLHATTRKLKLIFNKPARDVVGELDEDKTRQVIMNFIDNGIYYTKEGSVTVNLKEERGKIFLTVVDTGIGVPKAARAKLFSKFFRAANAKVARPDGTGLGLFLAKKVIEEQGGKLIFATEEGKGSTFGFELPKLVKEGK